MIARERGEDGHDDHNDDEEEEDVDALLADAGGDGNPGQHAFLLDAVLELQLLPATPKRALRSLVWRDMEDGKEGRRGWTFLVDVAAADGLVTLFLDTAYACMWERVHGHPYTKAPAGELEAYRAELRERAHASMVGRKRLPADGTSGSKLAPAAAFPDTLPAAHEAPMTPLRKAAPGPVQDFATPTPMSTGPTAPSTPALKAVPPVPVGNSMVQVPATLYLFDVRVNQFVPPMQDARVSVDIVRTDTYAFSLLVTQANGTPFISQPVEPRMAPTFNQEHGSFVWVWFEEETNRPMYSWSLVFQPEDFEEFQAIFSRAIFESLHLARLEAGDEAYNRLAYQEDVEMMDAERDAEDDGEEDGDGEPDTSADEADEDKDQSEGDAKISQLAVGHNHERSFVVRGSSIGVFKHTEDDKLKYSTSISNIKTMDGVSFSPRKVMLHEQDASMLLMHPEDRHSVMRMDLEYGKVVEQWKVDDILPVDEILPDRKYAQCTGEKTFIGINHNSLFRIDPRQGGNKRVEAQSKQYVSKNKFSCAATTGAGEVAVASEKGDIRLFNKLNVRAKTQLPGLGDPIIGIDTTENGRWILATCKTYLLLIDTLLEDGGFAAPVPLALRGPVLFAHSLLPGHTCTPQAPRPASTRAWGPRSPCLGACSSSPSTWRGWATPSPLPPLASTPCPGQRGRKSGPSSPPPGPL